MPLSLLSLNGAASTRCVLRAAAASSSSRRHVNPTLVPSTHRRAHTRVGPLVLTRASGEEKDEEVLDVGAMVDVDAIRAAVNDDPEVRAQEQKIAKEARNMASIQVDAEMAQEEAKIAVGDRSDREGCLVQDGASAGSRARGPRSIRRGGARGGNQDGDDRA
jgi:hypothetical protein